LIIKGRSAEMAAWAGRRANQTFVPPFEAWGIADNEGRITGVVVFNDYTDRNVEVSTVGHGWTRGVLRAIAHKCFVELNCSRVSVTTRASNSFVRGLVTRLGGKCEGVKRQYFDDDDAVIYGILQDEFLFK
jgi:RimJ/RimL family protein N-acetyltransferase